MNKRKIWEKDTRTAPTPPNGSPRPKPPGTEKVRRLIKCIECNYIFGSLEESRLHHKETGHWLTMMDVCHCPMDPECIHTIEGCCNYHSSKESANK